MFLNKIRNIFCAPDTKFVSAANVARASKRGNICVGNNVSATMCPRLPAPLHNIYVRHKNYNEEAFSSRIIQKKKFSEPPTGVDTLSLAGWQDTCHTYKNLVYDYAHHESPIAQWLERPTGILKVMDSTPVGASENSFSE